LKIRASRFDTCYLISACATRSHERSEFDGILISFIEPGPAPAPRTRRAADASWCWALTEAEKELILNHY
jgi:hypothetical protein